VQLPKDKIITMANFNGKLILIMMIYVAQKAQDYQRDDFQD